jgi:branched-chain amino acid transport system ATP-binding protein
MTAMLELVGVTKSFGGIRANDHVSLRVGQGAVVGLIGPNGSGKTTLFNAIAGAHPIDSGSIGFKGEEISKLLAGEIARRGIIRTFQQPRIYRQMSVAANMLVSAAIRHAPFVGLFGRAPHDAEARGAELLDFVGLAAKTDSLAGDLSFGQQKLLELAMALVNDPELLLLDEPTAGINPVLIGSLIDRLKAANKERGLTLLVIEHNMPVIMGLAEHIYCLAHGKLLAEGPPQKIKRDAKVLDAYLGAA